MSTGMLIYGNNNTISGNKFVDFETGIVFEGDNNYAAQNEMVNVTVPYRNNGQNNTIIPYTVPINSRIVKTYGKILSAIVIGNLPYGM